jgi:hypothetical protein
MKTLRSKTGRSAREFGFTTKRIGDRASPNLDLIDHRKAAAMMNVGHESVRKAVAAELVTTEFGDNQHTGGSTNLSTLTSQDEAAAVGVGKFAVTIFPPPLGSRDDF